MDEATHGREAIEPPLAGDEVATLLGSLERQRATFAWKVGGLDAEALAVRVAASEITLGGLVKHLAFTEELWFSTMLHGRAPGEPWDAVDWGQSPEWPWTSAAHDSPQHLYELWRAAVVRARAAVDEALVDGGLDRRLVWQPGNDGERPSLRRVLVDLIEEYARHVGHADLIRESIDGLVGEDPPGAPELYPPR
ncbi:mycothiol transferase [Oerskovia enterophila]